VGMNQNISIELLLSYTNCACAIVWCDQ
jgi:hypothetical protein